MTTATLTLAERLSAATGTVVFGSAEPVRQLLIALLAQGHIMLEGPPGLGKTLLAKTLATQLGGSFRRIQCTPDLMPADMIGLHVYRGEQGGFEFQPGPLFADVVLVDELNRTGPRTQSALLEAMEERQVSLDRQTYPLPENFLVIATQNPHEFEGTYPLPESQLDRFLMRLQLSYPTPEVEAEILMAYDAGIGAAAQRLSQLPLIDRAELVAAREELAAIRISPAVYAYATALATASRQHPSIDLGISTRGLLALMRCARAAAALDGLDYVTPDHIKQLAVPVMAHRLMPSADAVLEGQTGASLVESVLARVPVPRDEPAAAPAAAPGDGIAPSA